MGSTLEGAVLWEKLLGRVAFGVDADGGGFLILKIQKNSHKYMINI